LYIVPVRRAECIKVLLSYLTRTRNVLIGPAPCKDRHALLLNQNIGHEACMAPVTVWKAMDGYQTMMEPDGQLIGRVCLVFKPVACISKKHSQRLADLVVRDSDVLFR